MSGPGKCSRVAARRLRFAVALAALLAIVQTLGLLHRVAHLGHVQGAGPLSARVAASVGPGEPTPLQALFSGHVDARDCILFDCISHADGACDEAAAAPVQAAPLPLAQMHPGWHVAAQAGGFQARAPPRLS